MKRFVDTFLYPALIEKNRKIASDVSICPRHLVRVELPLLIVIRPVEEIRHSAREVPNNNREHETENYDGRRFQVVHRQFAYSTPAFFDAKRIGGLPFYGR